MARRPRLLLPGQLHHVLLRGNNDQPVFIDDEDRHACRQVLGQAAEANGLVLHAWLLLPSRIHLLVTPRTAEALPRVMQALGRQYVRLFNARHRRSGTLWEGRFRSSLVEGARFGLACQQYLEYLPVQLGLVGLPDDHPWSSCRHHLGLLHEHGLQPQPAYWALGNTPFDRELAWQALLRPEAVRAALEDVQQVLVHHDLARALASSHPVASTPWLRRLELIHECEIHFRTVGRPVSRLSATRPPASGAAAPGAGTPEALAAAAGEAASATASGTASAAGLPADDGLPGLPPPPSRAEVERHSPILAEQRRWRRR